MGFLDTLFGGNATKKAGKQNAAALQGLNTRGQAAINAGEEKAGGFLSQVGGLYQPYADAGVAATNMRSNGLGLNGAEGSAEALGVLRNTPGYQFAQEAASQGAARAASAGGMLASGNTLAALADRSQGIADQTQGSWLDRLLQTSNQGLQAAQGQATGLTNQAGLVQDAVGQRVGLDASVIGGMNANRNNVASAQEQGVNNMLNLGQKFLGFL